MDGTGGAVGASLWLMLMFAAVLVGTRKLWLSPKEYWQAHQRRVAGGRNSMSNTIMTFIPLDPLGFVNSRKRYLRYSRFWWGFIMATLLCLLILQLAGVLPAR